MTQREHVQSEVLGNRISVARPAAPTALSGRPLVRIRITLGLSACALACASLSAADQAARARVVFMEPIASLPGPKPHTYALITDAERLATYRGWLENESAKRALDLYERAHATMRRRSSDQTETPPFYIAVVPRGNHVDVGFRLQTDEGVKNHLETFYIKLGPQPERFTTTLFHETGHIVLAVLNDNDAIPTQKIASIPHSTAALTDRGTAFNEGFAIHLETLAAHLNSDADTRRRYHYGKLDFGESADRRNVYYRHAADLMSFSQNLARYREVVENTFAFASAFREPDYLRVQLEKSRDFILLRGANQLLQSEGFYASFFFTVLMRGEAIPEPSVLAKRQDKMLAALAEMFASVSATPDTPYLIEFVTTYMRLYPKEAAQIADVLLDLSHGVFVDAHAHATWRKHYLAALQLDTQKLRDDSIERTRIRWRMAVASDPQILRTRLGPQIPCQVPEVKVWLIAFGNPAPLGFDLNTVQQGIMRMIPGISDGEVKHWLMERLRQPYVDVDDFKGRCNLSDAVLAKMKL